MSRSKGVGVHGAMECIAKEMRFYPKNVVGSLYAVCKLWTHGHECLSDNRN